METLRTDVIYKRNELNRALKASSKVLLKNFFFKYWLFILNIAFFAW